MTFDELLATISALSRADKVRLREWLDQQLARAEEEIRGRDWSLESEVREIRDDAADRDYLSGPD